MNESTFQRNILLLISILKKKEAKKRRKKADRVKRKLRADAFHPEIEEDEYSNDHSCRQTCGLLAFSAEGDWPGVTG